MLCQLRVRQGHDLGRLSIFTLNVTYIMLSFSHHIGDLFSKLDIGLESF